MEFLENLKKYESCGEKTKLLKDCGKKLTVLIGNVVNIRELREAVGEF